MGLTEAAREYLGVPFKHQGRTRAGMDCAGLVYNAAKDCGVSLVDVEPGYGRLPSGAIVEGVLALSDKLTKFPRNVELQKDDILVFRFTDEPQHLAIFTGANLIHAYSAAGKVSEHKFVGFWRSRLVAVYRITV